MALLPLSCSCSSVAVAVAVGAASAGARRPAGRRPSPPPAGTPPDVRARLALGGLAAVGSLGGRTAGTRCPGPASLGRHRALRSRWPSGSSHTARPAARRARPGRGRRARSGGPGSSGAACWTRRRDGSSGWRPPLAGRPSLTLVARRGWSPTLTGAASVPAPHPTARGEREPVPGLVLRRARRRPACCVLAGRTVAALVGRREPAGRRHRRTTAIEDGAAACLGAPGAPRCDRGAPWSSPAGCCSAGGHAVHARRRRQRRLGAVLAATAGARGRPPGSSALLGGLVVAVVRALGVPADAAPPCRTG